MRKLPTRSILAIALAACTPLAFAAAPQATSSAPTSSAAPQWSGHHGQAMHGMHGQRTGMWDQLDLSDTQSASIRQLKQQSFKQDRAGMQALRQQRMAFKNAAPGSADYQSSANALATAEANAAHDRVLREADLNTKIYNVLTPAQRTKLASLRAEHQAKMQQWREAHMHRADAPSSAAPAASSN